MHPRHSAGYLEIGGATVAWLVRVTGAAPSGSAGMLTGREAAIVASFTSERRREEWVSGRGAAKALLAREMGLAGACCEVLPDAGRAPIAAAVVPGGLSRRLPCSLSISHRGGAVAAALLPAAAGRVGVDLEVMERRSEALLQDHFTREESMLPEALPARWRLHAIPLLWSLKEAVLKAAGVGLSVPTGDAEILDLAWTGDDGRAEIRGSAEIRGAAAAGGGTTLASLACIARAPHILSLAVVRAVPGC